MNSGNTKVIQAKRALRAGNYSRCEFICERLLKRNPKDIDALRLLVDVARQRKDKTKLRSLLNRALQFVPTDKGLLYHAARFNAEFGKGSEAEIVYKHLISHYPSEWQALFELGLLYRRHNQISQARTSLEQAEKIHPEHFPIRLELAHCYRELGCKQEACEFYDWVLDSDPLCPDAFYHRSRMGGMGVDSPYVGNVIDVLNKEDLSGRENESFLCFGLGNIYDKSGVYEEAFKWYRRANHLQKEKQPFDLSKITRLVDACIETFDAGFFELHQGGGNDTQAPVFIIGMPRSGSTLLEQILTAHPSVYGGGEIDYLYNTAFSLPQRIVSDKTYPECCADITPDQISQIVAPYLEGFEILSPSSSRYVDKTLGNFFHLGLLSLLFPRARFLHTVRDPLDTCLSCYFQLFAGSDLDFTYDLDALGSYYKEYQRLMDHWRKVVPVSLMDVDYAKMTSNPKDTIPSIIDFLGLEWDERCLDPSAGKRVVRTSSDSQVRKGIYRSSVERWRHYEDQLAGLRQVLAL